MNKVVPIVLAGGVGTRLWPLSRRSYPKQFKKISDAPSLFQKTVQRFQSSIFTRPIVVTHEDYRFHIVEQMGEVSALPELVLLEPFSRNTAPAILAAILAQADRDPNALCLVAPADHLLPDSDAFTEAIERGIPLAKSGRIVTFGIAPDRPETGYGYVELSIPAGEAHTGSPIVSFTEKPNKEHAAKMLEAGNFLWNAGIFLFRCSDMIRAFEEHAPDMLTGVQQSLARRELDLGFTRLESSSWAKVRDISIDYAIMEKTGNLSVVPYMGHWSDLGSWQAMWQEKTSATNPSGTATIGNAHAIDCTDSLLMADSDRQVLVGLGLKDLIAVAMDDAVLVADRQRSEEVGSLVKILREKGVPQSSTLPRDYRPWGWFETQATGAGFQVKTICVHPGGVLSLQSHAHRAEHWVVVDGTATVTIGDAEFDLAANQSTYVPRGEKHRLRNDGTEDVLMIEVQTGPYLGEDDITRYEDAYARD